jgi:hypothetical protein
MVQSGAASRTSTTSSISCASTRGGACSRPSRANDGWFVLRGVQQNGGELNLLHPEAPLSWDPPRLGSAEYSTFRWRKYYRDLRRDRARAKRARPAYLAYWCRTWNAEHSGDARMDTLELVFMRRNTKRRGGFSPPEQQSLARGTCAELATSEDHQSYAQARCAPGDAECQGHEGHEE